jgi:hypothetical protein
VMSAPRTLFRIVCCRSPGFVNRSMALVWIIGRMTDEFGEPEAPCCYVSTWTYKASI